LSNCILTAEHIQKKYGSNTVLRDVSIHINRGEIYGLVGKNGSGKTTLLRILTGQIQRYNGSVSAVDDDIPEPKVAAVINSPSLFLNLTAFENMKEQAFLLGMKDDGRIKQILKVVGLDNCNNKPVRNFSLGMTQRLKLGLALLKNPDILILDEPLNGLDPDGIADLRELLLNLNNSNGTTIMISSHILSELEQIVTCLGILHDGEIVKEASTPEIRQHGATLESLYMQYTKGEKIL
jgi:ABC-type multidrug transport system ATPase subunit